MSVPSSVPEEKRARRKQLKTLREKLAAERSSWARWMPKLKRSFHEIEKLDRRISRLERLIAALTTS